MTERGQRRADGKKKISYMRSSKTQPKTKGILHIHPPPATSSLDCCLCLE